MYGLGKSDDSTSDPYSPSEGVAGLEDAFTGGFSRPGFHASGRHCSDSAFLRVFTTHGSTNRNYRPEDGRRLLRSTDGGTPEAFELCSRFMVQHPAQERYFRVGTTAIAASGQTKCPCPSGR